MAAVKNQASQEALPCTTFTPHVALHVAVSDSYEAGPSAAATAFILGALALGRSRIPIKAADKLGVVDERS